MGHRKHLFYRGELIAMLIAALVAITACPSPRVDDSPLVFAELDEDDIAYRHAFILDVYAARLGEAQFVYRSLQISYASEEVADFDPELFARFEEAYAAFQVLMETHHAHLDRFPMNSDEAHPFLEAHEAHLDAQREQHEALAIEHEFLMFASDRAGYTDAGTGHRALLSRHREMMELMEDMLYFAPREVDVELSP